MKFDPITAARRAFAADAMIHGRASVSRYALEPRFEIASDGWSGTTCGGSTRYRSASAALMRPAAIDARKVWPTLPFTEPMPTSGPPGLCSPQSRWIASISRASISPMPEPSASMRPTDGTAASASRSASDRIHEGLSSGLWPTATDRISA